ncbi:MAG TPA: hypothetical protein VK453_24705 [Micromonosporaceae bacterium]|nr:hypothetical protein [Micromonosporaceae bacterium]
MNVDQYAESELQRLLTEDPRVAEQGIRVVRLDNGLALCGEVESDARRELIGKIVTEAFPGVDVRLDIGLTRMQEPNEAEKL